MGSFRRYRDGVLVVLLLAIPFFFLKASIRNPEELSVVEQALMRVAAPFEYVSAALARTVSGVIGDYFYMVDVKADNNKLAYENERLRAKVSALLAVDAENQRLKSLIGLRDRLAPEAVSAVVVAKDTTNYFRVTRLTLDAPATGLKEHMPVIAVGGVVGTVQRVAGEKVDVRLSVDSGFGVDVVDERTKARGIVRGLGDEGKYLTRVQYMERADKVDVGDILLTSGLGCRFPPGIPVAEVTEVIPKDFGSYQEVLARPTVDFSRLSDVLILLEERDNCESGRP